MRTIGIHMALTLCTLLLSCGQTEKGPKSEPQSTQGAPPRDSLTIALAGADSTTVFELLTQNYDVDYQSSAMGIFVKGIDSIYADDQYFWVYSVNDTMAQTAADRYVTSDSDRVLWHFRRLGQ